MKTCCHAQNTGMLHGRNLLSARSVKGFTLVELLVVIAIIALLLSILMPSLGRAREQGKRVVCASHDKQTGLAMNMWIEENSGYLMPWRVQEQGVGQGLSSWAIALAPYVGGKTNDPTKAHKVFMCPSAEKITPDSDGFRSGYGCNATGVFCNVGPGYPATCPNPPKYLAYHQPAKLLAVTDGEGLMKKGTPFAYPAVFRTERANRAVGGWKEGMLYFAIHNGVPYNRHLKGVNVLFLDWHVEWRTRKDVMKTPSDDGLWGTNFHWH
jgi:prepilin-type N-terminal cleavage/methylation domain-containing protein/prepilin-type processing-associated H-X9-DG protein